MALRRVSLAQLGTDLVKVFFDADVQEYVVRITGKAAADYFTDDKVDALRTAQKMRNNMLTAE